jgi:hypothetical protein
MKKNTTFLASLIFLGLILFFAYAKHETAWKGTVFTEDNITVVKNPKEPIYNQPVFELQEDLTISGSGEDEEQMFQDIHTLDIDAKGRYMASQRLKMNPLIWKKGLMYAIQDDEEGFNIVERYLVKWKQF